MKIKFKLNVEELATLCHMASDIDGSQAKSDKLSIISMYIFIFISSIYLYNFYSFKYFISTLIAMLLILATFVYLSNNNKFMRKKMLKLAKMNVKKIPQLLDWQTIEIDDNYIIHTQLSASTKTGL